MPEFVLNRNHVHRSTSGVISFEKGVPTFVPPHMVKEVAGIGAEPVNGERPEMLDPERKQLPVVEGDERTAQLFLAFDLLVDRNDAADFTAQGVPSVKAIGKIIDFEVDRSEVVAAWGEYKVSKA